MAYGKEAIRGLSALRKAFKALPDVTREALNEATEDTIERVRAKAVQLVPVRHGFLRAHIAARLSRKSGVGRVGVTSGTATDPNGKTVNPARYAHLVEFGTSQNSAQPFMIPALEGEQRAYLERCRKAGQTIERDMAKIGSRNE